MAVPKTTNITTGNVSGGKGQPDARGAPGHAAETTRLAAAACGIGAKGFRVYDWAMIDTTIPVQNGTGDTPHMDITGIVYRGS
jgi:hypothetical protein